MTRYHGQQYIYLFILIVSLGFIGWYYAQPSLYAERIPDKVLVYLPDVIVKNLDITQFNEQGFPTNHLYTPELMHFPHQNLSQFTKPRIILYPQHGAPWFILADKGEAELGVEKITLLNNVVLHQNALGNEKARTITTSAITYYSQKDFVETPQMIYFEEPGLRVKSLGMTADLKKQQVNLLQHVSSEYIQNENN